MDIKLDGQKFTITGELEAPRPSSTGKSLIVYTSGGFVLTADGLRVNLTIIKAK